MRKLSFILATVFILSQLLFTVDMASAKSSSYYRSAQTGRFTTKNYSTKNPSTTMKQSRR